MKQTARIISTYSADTFGVCSALFELGGMVVMHDASGCNSTYTTHDEPRWYDMDSMVYISGLSEMEAIMGDDEKLISDIAEAAESLQPRFIAIAGTPIPTMTGFDFTAVAELVEERTGIPTFGFPTTGMNTYVYGASMAFEGIARRFIKRNVEKTVHLSVNILGLTPLDFSVNGADASIVKFLEEEGFEVISKWAMGSTLEELSEAGRASVNLVVSATGLGAAKALKEMFGTPYVVGTPIGKAYQKELKEALIDAAEKGETEVKVSNLPSCEIAVIGEGITSLSLAQAIELEYGRGVKVLCATECEKGFLREKDVITPDEEDVIEALKGIRMVIADPLYRPICPADAKFIPLPAENFSGRIYRNEIPNLIAGFED
ncbi:MAG: oxidoreductase [Lachnospiraceae bacterium]|nr:oxidoreductase [Lachnospiraceae bacterium]